MLVQAAEVRPSIVDWLVILVLLVLFHDFGIVAVGQQDDHLVEIGRDCRRLGERRVRRQGMPGPYQSDRHVGVAVRLHRVDLVVQRGPVVAQRHDPGQRAAVVHRVERVAVGGARRGVLHVVGLGAVADAALPIVLPIGAVTAAARCPAVAVEAADVVPRLVLVGGADIDRGVERDDRDLDIARSSWRPFASCRARCGPPS